MANQVSQHTIKHHALYIVIGAQWTTFIDCTQMKLAKLAVGPMRVLALVTHWQQQVGFEIRDTAHGCSESLLISWVCRGDGISQGRDVVTGHPAACGSFHGQDTGFAIPAVECRCGDLDTLEQHMDCLCQ